MSKKLDLVAVGRAGVDLYGQQIGGRLEDMASFAKYIGGSPTNSVIGASRLGLNCALLTRVGADHMGRFIREELERERVDTRGVVTDPDRLTALVILGIRDRHRFPLLFYRENCADMALETTDIDAGLVGDGSALLISGTHLSTDRVRAATMRAVEIARQTGAKVVLDIDYRPVLWGLADKDMGENRFVAAAEVTGRLQEVAPRCHLIVGTEEEFHILGGSTETMDALRAVRRTTDAILVCKLGAEGCAAFPNDIPDTLGDADVVPGFPVEVFNVLGAGDAFMAGFLSGWIRDEPLERCCVLGNACGAIVVSRHGCAPAMPTAAELDHFLKRDDLPRRLSEDEALNDLHWSTTRRAVPDELTILAVDHRTQFDELASEAGADESRISRFKSLAFEALDRVAQRDPSFGIIVDGRFGWDVLARASDGPYWVGRPIEVPKSRPLEFEGEGDVGLELLTWPPAQVVKCLAFYAASDPPEVRDVQERRLLQLFAACRNTGHELLLEIIAPADAATDGETTAHSIERLYEIGIKPDWWKLEPSSSASKWQGIVDVIERHDPRCRGIVLLGLSAPIAELAASFEVAARFRLIKGFAVGRSIFHDVARDWLEEAMSDTDAVKLMGSRLSTLVETWRSARSRLETAA